MSSLLDPAFLTQLEALRRRLDVRARSGGAGERAARGRGGISDFQEHRAYAPGDDLRRLDWLAFARTGEAVVKLFRSEEDVVVRILIDASQSLTFGDPPKIEVARRVAAAIGYLALAGAERAQVLVAKGRTAERSPPPLERLSAPRRGRASIAALFADLGRIDAGGAVDLSRAIERVLVTARRPGMLVVLSDFFDASAFTDSLGRARAAGHDVALIQLLSREDSEPSFEGDHALIDCETEQAVEMTFDSVTLNAYLAQLSGLVQRLGAWARSHGASYLFAFNSESVEDIVIRFLERGVTAAPGKLRMEARAP